MNQDYDVESNLYVWYNRDGTLKESELPDMPSLYCTADNISDFDEVEIRVLNGAWSGILNVKKGTLRIDKDLTLPVFFKFIPRVQDLTITDGTPTSSWVWTEEKLSQFHAAMKIVHAGRSEDEIAFQNAVNIAKRDDEDEL